ncbi:unnamed protein product [Brachionus calyciflorus]|uniref:Uncharacterized protein n=1 Tax=Brachionus calyciflorus TaxID=104777 RepID=A0A813VYZ0_9BILA|nr:unnamed protein product [Brachionus calyciflorus]
MHNQNHLSLEYSPGVEAEKTSNFELLSKELGQMFSNNVSSETLISEENHIEAYIQSIILKNPIESTMTEELARVVVWLKDYAGGASEIIWEKAV